MRACVGCRQDTQSARSPRCPSCRRERRRQVNLATVRRYQASERGRKKRAAYMKSDARREALSRYNRSPRGRERWRKWYWGQPGVAAAAEPLPMPYVGDPLFERARAITGIKGDTEYGNDLLGEVVLALLEGRDPEEAMHRYRSEQAAWSAVTFRPRDMGAIGRTGKGDVVFGFAEEAA